jgi:hypothetical protein
MNDKKVFKKRKGALEKLIDTKESIDEADIEILKETKSVMKMRFVRLMFSKN